MQESYGIDWEQELTARLDADANQAQEDDVVAEPDNASEHSTEIGEYEFAYEASASTETDFDKEHSPLLQDWEMALSEPNATTEVFPNQDPDGEQENAGVPEGEFLESFLDYEEDANSQGSVVDSSHLSDSGERSFHHEQDHEDEFARHPTDDDLEHESMSEFDVPHFSWETTTIDDHARSGSDEIDTEGESDFFTDGSEEQPESELLSSPEVDSEIAVDWEEEQVLPTGEVQAMELLRANKALLVATSEGNRNINKLTDLVFFSLHPERDNKPISNTEPDSASLVARWKQLRDSYVLPFLGAMRRSQRLNKTRGPLPEVSVQMPHPSNDQYRFKSNTVRIFGVQEVIDALKWITAKWHERRPEIRLGMGDISQKGGGQIGQHLSHRVGLDADLSLNIRSTGERIKRGSRYERLGFRKYAKEFVELAVSNPHLEIKTVWFFDHTIHRRVPKSNTSSRHYRHFHIRFVLPDRLRNSLDFGRVYGANAKRVRRQYLSRRTQTEFTEEHSSVSSFSLSSITNPIRVLSKLISQGDFDEDSLTNALFALRHPERQGRSLSKGEPGFPALSAEWLNIREQTVRPFLAALGKRSGEQTDSDASRLLSQIRDRISEKRDAWGIGLEVEASIIRRLWPNRTSNRLRSLAPRNVSKAVRLAQESVNHILASMRLIEKTSLRDLVGASDMNFALALGTREGGKTLLRRDHEVVVTAGRDTHPHGVGGLDFLYNKARFFHEAGIRISKVPPSELKEGRKSRKPARIEARYLLFANMVEISSREKVLRDSQIPRQVKALGIAASPRELYRSLSKDANRAWRALSYSGAGYVTSTVAFILRSQAHAGRAFDLNAILTDPFEGYSQRHRVFLARTAAIRASAMDATLRLS